MGFRGTVEALAADGDLLVVEERVAEPDVPLAVAAEAARASGPAVLLEDVPGRGRLACGVRGGPDRMERRERFPWSRLARGMGLPADTAHVSLLEALTSPPPEPPSPEERPAAAEDAVRDATALSLPTVPASDRPILPVGLLAARHGDEQVWAPLRGELRGRTGLRLHVPRRAAEDGASVTVALGVPTAALVAAHLSSTDTQPWRGWDAPGIAAALDDVAVAASAGGVVPASAEVLLEGTLARGAEGADTPRAAWETVVDPVAVAVDVHRVATRPEPILPVAALGEPLSEDTHLASLTEAARLQARVNGYWGVSPVGWIGLPVEAELGVCLVASEVLYAGFEWQLANTLFSFGTSFDKVVVLDTDTAFEDLGNALDDVWVKAHPSNDWVFSEAAAPAATAPAYRTDGETGSRLYVNAAWDPRWDEEYIAPKVRFGEYPEEVRRAVRERWERFGFDGEPEMATGGKTATDGEAGTEGNTEEPGRD